MKRLFSSFSLLLFFLSAVVLYKFWPLSAPDSVVPPSVVQEIPIDKPVLPGPVQLKRAQFSQLPGWKDASLKKSFLTFQLSCNTFLKQDPQADAGSNQIPLKVKDWLPACKAAKKLSKVDEKKARSFFRKWFVPFEFFQDKPVDGLFTGYYLPLLHGSLAKTSEFNVPIYGLPDNIVTVNPADFGYKGINRRLVGRVVNGKLLPFHVREEINKGVLKENAPVLLWVDSHIDRLYLEIQGSGIVKLPNGETIFLGYAGENGASYTPIGRVLIEKGIMTKENASMQSIRAYLEAHPDEILPVTNKNESFVFFKQLKNSAAMGAQGVPLTPGYSLAVDRKWIPLGTPLWLDTSHPAANMPEPQTFQRLMIAQDTGGAIRGQVRGDVFWGEGEEATYTAGLMKNPGHYWLFLPRHAEKKLPKQFD
ncbi:Membrane-bound lytic murein transglycosylase [Legionella birminghamensis]|uniref:Membrane-bound lytic murein transglycosylase A n=1 Tax=Legionella birminghamensis TaxID=28083 RepID=A0A378I9L7_9GAMM|nr:MltA domain-containing protein [Legionella birminghamensis]KTC69270.1 Membrane-bound lytic murein transglycosylase [Legionella birminghamensis]STX31532.1 Membrane-bound lytic murein transglycosylase [Legionella birminghamensis]